MFSRFRLMSGAMRKQARLAIELCGLLTCLLALGLPAAAVHAQDEEEEEAEAEEGDAEGGDLDSMMATDPDRPAKPEGEEAEGDGEAQSGDDERPAGESEGDDERPPGEVEDEAEAEEQPVAPVATGTEGFEAAILGGYGISLSDGPNIWSAGFGLRLGYDLGPFVLGARFVYFTGGTDEQVIGGRFTSGMTVEVSANIWELSVEAAYDAELSPTVSLRPGLGLGFASATRTGADSKLYGAISPGIALLITPAGSFFLGLETRFQIVTAQPEAVNGLLLFATVGMRF